MSIAHLGNQASVVARQGYPADGSKALPRRLERLCGLLATEEYTYTQLGEIMRVDERTIRRVVKRAPVAARLRHLRESLRSAAYDAEPLVDKRNRVVLAGGLARTLHAEGERKGWRDTVAMTKQGTEITGFDWRRTDQVRQLLDYIAKEVGDRSTTPNTTVNVSTSISMEDAAVRVAALFSRMPDVIEAESEEVKGDALSEGGVEG